MHGSSRPSGFNLNNCLRFMDTLGKFGEIAVNRVYAALFGLLLVSSGCSAGRAGPHEITGQSTSSALTYALGAAPYTITLNTPASVATQDVALDATNYIEIDGLGGQVIRSNSSLLSTIVSLGAGGVQIDAGGSAGNVWAPVKAVLLPGATANGNVYSNAATLDPGSTVKGTVVGNPTINPLTTTSWSLTFPAATVSDVEVFGGTTASKAPGRYGYVQVDAGATLKLTSGVYYVEGLTLLSLSTIQIDQTMGPVFIYVHNLLSYSGTIVPTTGGFPDVLVAYFGVPNVTLSSPFQGTLISTVGSVTLGTFVPPHVGSFFAPTITVSTGATVTRHPVSRELERHRDPTSARPGPERCEPHQLPRPGHQRQRRPGRLERMENEPRGRLSRSGHHLRRSPVTQTKRNGKPMRTLSTRQTVATCFVPAIGLCASSAYAYNWNKYQSQFGKTSRSSSSSSTKRSRRSPSPTRRAESTTTSRPSNGRRATRSTPTRNTRATARR